MQELHDANFTKEILMNRIEPHQPNHPVYNILDPIHFNERVKTYYNENGLHRCGFELPSYSYGPAIDDCFEDEKGFLFVTNGEYSSVVNFCPFCGYESKNKITKP